MSIVIPNIKVLFELTKIVGGYPIKHIVPGSKSDQVGIKSGDILLSINETPISSMADYASVSAANPGAKTYKIWRAGEELTFIIE